MYNDTLVYSIFLIFTGAAVVATLALYARQALLIAYILLGVAMGPWGLGLISDATLIQDIASVGIMFLLFLLGLNLYPQKLIKLLRETTIVTLLSALLFGLLGFLVAYGFGLVLRDSIVVGIATIFSSTIIGLKLLPTTVLHHRHTGEVIISILLLQDLIAILVLLVLHGFEDGSFPWGRVGLLVLALPGLGLFAYLAQRFVLARLFAKFDRIQEYIFLLAIGWCLGLAELARSLGLSHEIGAFIAGVSLAASPISQHIAESLKPLRDFFLVMFFFALGAGFNLPMAEEVMLPAMLLAIAVMLIKPVSFRFLLVKSAETNELSWETGVRLGQMSEFSLLISFIALESGLIAIQAAYLIQLATLLTFMISSFLIVRRYPTPIAVSDRLRRD